MNSSKTSIKKPDELFREMLKKLRESGKRNGWKVFSDFCELAYCAIAKRTAQSKERREELESRYMRCVKQYNRDQAIIFSRMLGCVITALSNSHEVSYQDFLGTIYEEEGFCDQRYGKQFFTPWDLCRLTAAMTMTDSPTVDIKPVVTVGEPCCGSGRLVLAIADYFQNNGREVATGMCACAMDIDVVCFQMSFLQFSLAGIPAIVQHGNTITLEIQESAITPAGIRLLNQSEYLRNWWNGIKQIKYIHKLFFQLKEQPNAGNTQHKSLL